MLSTFFRPKWQHKDPAIRLQAVAGLTAAKDSATLVNLALNDDNAQVRQTAIAKLESLNQLKEVFNQSRHNSDKNFAQQCWCAVLNNPDLTPAANAENTVLDCNDAEWLAAIACHSENASLRELALTGLRDETVIFRLLTDSRLSRLWPALIDQLTTEAQLKQAAQLVKGRDKKTAQIVRQRLEAIAQQAENEKAQLAHSENIINKLQHLISSEHTPLFEGLLLNLQNQVQALRCDAPLYQDIQTHLQQAQQKLLEQQQREALANQQQLLIKEAKAILNKLSATLVWDEASQHALESFKNSDNRLKTAELNQLVQEIQSLADKVEGLKPLLAKLESLNSDNASKLHRDQQQQLLKTLDSAKNLCQGHKALQNRYAQQLAQQEKWLKQAQVQQQQKHVDQRHEIDALIDAADTAISESDFNEVRRLYHKVKPLIAAQSADARKMYQAALQRMQATTAALEDWKAFAADPKREALCVEMEKLISLDIHAADKAQRIKELSEQWKALGFCQDQAIWQRFRELSDQAYAPCKRYFDEQKQKKAFNAEQRQTICEQLEQFVNHINWQHCEYRSIDKLYRQIDAEWQKYSLLENKDFKALQQRYSQSMQLIKEKLQQEKQRNLATLEQLVSQAKALINDDDVNQALTQYNALHEQWKATGLTFHKPQQSLWQELREAGDALYQKRNQQRVQAEETLQANLQQAQALINEIATCQQLAELENLSARFNAIDGLPRNAVKRVRQDFQQAVQKFHEKQALQNQRAFYTQLATVRSWANNAFAAEQQGNTASAVNSEWPAAWQKVLSSRLNAEQADLLVARKLCIELEMLTENASPSDDSALRMELQMAQLAQHFNQGSNNQFTERFTNLYLRWSALAGGKIAGFAALAERFNRIADPIIEAK